jgi:hypothetical protein
MITIVLSQDAENTLKQPIEGKGGFQSLLEKLRNQYNFSTRNLALDKDSLERVKRYAKKYGGGGWEERLKNIFKDNPEILK